jgi:transcription-repair coupling factor (superfamily II helicase)
MFKDLIFIRNFANSNHGKNIVLADDLLCKDDSVRFFLDAHEFMRFDKSSDFNQMLMKISSIRNTCIIISSDLQKKKYPSKNYKYAIKVQKHDSCDMNIMINQVSSFGYTRLPVADEENSFAVNGDIVDINISKKVYRISLFEDSIEFIKNIEENSYIDYFDITRINIDESELHYDISEYIDDAIFVNLIDKK